MNLIKSFNYKYLKENIKKSKGLIMLLLIVVPLLTTLFTVLFVNGEDGVNVADDININWVNILGMYVIPIGISFALFGYVYKKNSVDLINSMPLNKQTIFITNTIGGIILITLMQLVTTILLFICGIVCSNLIIFTKMLIDIFIIMWIAYIFMFLATNLAMTVSGTFFTQLVLTVLILFFIPFTIINFGAYTFEESYTIIQFQEENSYAAYSNSYALPIQIPISLVMSGILYNFNSIMKTILLGIIYFVLGLILFKRRKMEDTEESFKNEKIHLLVKALTVFPMVVFLNKMEFNSVLVIFIIAIISIYYFAYDFIVKRKIKLIVSIISLVLTLLGSYLIDVTIDKIEENLLAPARTIKVEDIQEFAINLRGNWTSDYEIDSYFMNNEELLNFIIKVGKENKHSFYDSSLFPNCTVRATFKTKTGKKVKSILTLYENELVKLIEILSKDEKYVKYAKEAYLIDGKICIDGKVVSKEFEKEIEQKIKDEVNNMNLMQIYNELMNNRSKFMSTFSKVYYNNHRYNTEYFKIEFSEEINKMIIDYQNKEAIKNLSKIDIETMDSMRIKSEYNSSYDNDSFIYSYDTREEIVKFIKDNEDVKYDPTQNCYQISFQDWDAKISGVFYTNKIDEIDEILKKEEKDIEIIEDNVTNSLELVY